MRLFCALLLAFPAFLAAAAATGDTAAPPPATDACVVDLVPGACVTVGLVPGGGGGGAHGVALVPGVSACTADAIELWLPSGAARTGRRRLQDATAARRDGAVAATQRQAPVACVAAPPGCVLPANMDPGSPPRRVTAVLRNGCASLARVRLHQREGGGDAAPPPPAAPAAGTTACCCSSGQAHAWPIYAPATCCCGPPGACCPSQNSGGGSPFPTPFSPPPPTAGGYAGFAAAYCEGRACGGLLAGTVFASVVFVGMGVALLVVFRRGPGGAPGAATGPPPPPPQPMVPLPVKSLATLRAEAALKAGGGGDGGSADDAPPPRRPDSAADARAAALAAAPDGDDALECPVCFDRPADAAGVVVFGCGHATCAICYKALLGPPTSPAACPLCRAPLKRPAAEGDDGDDDDRDVEAGTSRRRRRRWWRPAERRPAAAAAPAPAPANDGAAAAGVLAGVVAASTVA